MRAGHPVPTRLPILPEDTAGKATRLRQGQIGTGCVPVAESPDGPAKAAGPRSRSVNGHPGMTSYPPTPTIAGRIDLRKCPIANRYPPRNTANLNAARHELQGGRAGLHLRRDRAQLPRNRFSDVLCWCARPLPDKPTKSGLTARPVMANFAVDSAMAVALASTLLLRPPAGKQVRAPVDTAPFAVMLHSSVRHSAGAGVASPWRSFGLPDTLAVAC